MRRGASSATEVRMAHNSAVLQSGIGVHATERVAQLIFGFVSVSQLRPRTASQAVSSRDTKKCMDTHGTPSVLDSVSSTLLVIDLDCNVPLNKRREMGVGNGDGMI